MANANLQIRDFMEMFNVGKDGKFSTDEAHTHGKLTLGADGNLRNVGRYDRGKTNYFVLEGSSASTKSTEDFSVREALIKALVDDVVGIDSDYLEKIRSSLGMPATNQKGVPKVAVPLSRRTVKRILIAHQEYKTAREERLSAANRRLDEVFTWEDSQQQKSFQTMLMRTWNGRPAADLFGVGATHDGQKEILQAIRDMAQEIQSYDQKRIFLSFVFSEGGSKALNAQWKDQRRADAIREALQVYKNDAAVFSGEVPSEYLDGWCSFLIGRHGHQPLKADDVEFVHGALDKLADAIPKLKGRKTLSPKDVNVLSKIIIPPEGACVIENQNGTRVTDEGRWAFVQDAVTHIACECGILSREMRHGILSDKKIAATIDGMLNEFEAHVSAGMNNWICDDNKRADKVATVRGDPQYQKLVKDVADRASQHILELRTIAVLLDGVDENANALYSDLMGGFDETDVSSYCPKHFKKAKDKNKPVNNLAHMVILKEHAKALIGAPKAN